MKLVMSKKPIELLSPVGSFESLQAAIQASASAVYFGVEQLNMRAKSINSFSVDDLKTIVSQCNPRGIKNYLTLNTVLYDHDMQLMRSIVQQAKKNGVDAIIASDFAVIQLCNEMGMPVHISTQANVSNIESVQFFSRFADVIVLARELTLKQTENITKEIRRKNITGFSGQPLKIEVFAHGALCMAISGKCYLSLHQQNASANRGACTQVCRRPYKVTDAESGEELLVDNEYIMSPKDLCTIDILDEVIASGVDVLKIEGRGKGPEYVYEVTRCYREAIDAIEQRTYTADKITAWKERLSSVYNRGFWEGYYLGRKLGEWTLHPGSAATEKKIYIGKCTKYYSGIKIGEFLMESGSIQKGDTILITGNRFGIHKEVLNNFRVNGDEEDMAGKGDKITFPLLLKPSLNDKLYKIVKTEHA
ncbi:MAG TPA: peptidase U32 family protein [Flavisolibacter sp.]|nr:peptidase U32 family protein [Flavisolibacter sp.]